MCFSTTIAALFGLSFAGCNAFQGLGPDPASQTDAVEISLPKGEYAYLIRCPQSTASCLSRAQAVCQGPFTVIPPAGRGPKVQALVDLEIRAINTDNPYQLIVACNR
jgi:hypothetical protein